METHRRLQYTKVSTGDEVGWGLKGGQKLDDIDREGDKERTERDKDIEGEM